MKVLNFFKNIICLLLIVVSLVFANVYMVLNSTAKLVSKENIVNMIKDIDIEDLIGADAKKEIYGTLEEAGVPTEYVSKIVENEELKETVGEYVSGTIEAVLEEQTIPTIDEKELKDTITNVFDIVVEETDNKYISKEEQQEVHKALDKYVPEIVTEINESQKEITKYLDENNIKIEGTKEMQEALNTLDKIQTIYQKRNLCLLGVFIPLIIVILLKLKDFKFITWASVTSLLYGISFILVGKMIPYIWTNYIAKELAELKTLIDSVINTVTSNYVNMGIICIVIGIVLMIVKIVIKKIRDNKLDEKLEEIGN